MTDDGTGASGRTYTPPLSAEDAAAIEHAAEIRILNAADTNSTIEDVEDYGEARHWLNTLMQGGSVWIADDALAYSRRPASLRDDR